MNNEITIECIKDWLDYSSRYLLFKEKETYKAIIKNNKLYGITRINDHELISGLDQKSKTWQNDKYFNEHFKIIV